MYQVQTLIVLCWLAFLFSFLSLSKSHTEHILPLLFKNHCLHGKGPRFLRVTPVMGAASSQGCSLGICRLISFGKWACKALSFWVSAVSWQCELAVCNIYVNCLGESCKLLSELPAPLTGCRELRKCAPEHGSIWALTRKVHLVLWGIRSREEVPVGWGLISWFGRHVSGPWSFEYMCVHIHTNVWLLPFDCGMSSIGSCVWTSGSQAEVVEPVGGRAWREEVSRYVVGLDVDNPTLLFGLSLFPDFPQMSASSLHHACTATMTWTPADHEPRQIFLFLGFFSHLFCGSYGRSSD